MSDIKVGDKVRLASTEHTHDRLGGQSAHQVGDVFTVELIDCDGDIVVIFESELYGTHSEYIDPRDLEVVTEYAYGDRVRLTEVEPWMDTAWIGLTGVVTTVEPNNEMVWIKPDFGRPDAHGLNPFIWPTKMLVKVEQEPLAEWEKELLAAGEKLHSEAINVDIVNHPNHYTHGKYEVLDVLEDWGLTKFSHLKDTVKYIARHEHKENPLQDLKKARFYLDREIRNREALLAQTIDSKETSAA